jgi:hypothetical protein
MICRRERAASAPFHCRAMARAITEIENEIRTLDSQAQERLLHVLLE